MEPYYLAYEKRYKAVYAAGANLWGHKPDDEVLVAALTDWVCKNNLQGKHVVEFACGEGSVGTILSRLGCIYHGFDISPLAVARSRKALADYPTASVDVLDMVNQKAPSVYDGALDVMGFHMLVIDPDREKYLANMHSVLKANAPALFFREVYRADAYSGYISSYEEWLAISESDYETPSPRTVENDGVEYTVNIPLVPARGKNKADYISEMTSAGFVVDDFIEMDVSKEIPFSASIYVHKGGG